MMMAGAPWTSVPVEQAHGSCAVLHRAHPMYGSAMISTRAMLHQARHFFVQDPYGRAAERRAAKLVRLEKKQPHNIIVRNVFLRDLMQEARSGLRQDERLSAASRQRVVRLHGALYKALPSRFKLATTVQHEQRLRRGAPTSPRRLSMFALTSR